VQAESEHPPIRTFKPRRGRITARQSLALEISSPYLLVPDGPLDLESLFDGRPVIVEIGFGTGITTAAMAKAEPAIGLLAIDVHTPGVGDLVARIHEEAIPNLLVIEGDAIQVLSTSIAPDSLVGIRSFFPDPWPKVRHHKRRLVQAERVQLIASRVAPGGTWDLATDWLPYAEHIAEFMATQSQWLGGPIERPEWRPITHYESIGLSHGRAITDFRYVRTEVAHAG
jgi:tRNA (guanine-N7-)-methyltransferase